MKQCIEVYPVSLPSEPPANLIIGFVTVTESSHMGDWEILPFLLIEPEDFPMVRKKLVERGSFNLRGEEVAVHLQ